MTRKLLVALSLLVTSAAVADSGKRQAWVRTALGSLPVAKADRTPDRSALRESHLDQFAAEIARVSKSAPRPPREWAALIATIGSHESNFDTDILANRCKPWQCDRGKARSVFQIHRLSYLAEFWDASPGNVTAQVTMVDRALRRSLVTCARLGVPYPASVFRAFAGRSCSWPLKDEAARVGTFNRLVSK